MSDQPTEKSRTSPQLKLVSRESELRSLERRKLPRLTVTSEQFRLTKTHKIFSLSDLSMEGMAFDLSGQDDVKGLSVGLLLDGTLNLKREKYAIQARIRNINPNRVGCEFENRTPELAQALKQILDPAVLGAEMKPIPSSEGNTLWYHGTSGTDLIFHRFADGKYRNFSLYVLNTYIQWEEENGLSTGWTVDSDQRSERSGILSFETLLLRADPKPDEEKLKVAKTVILSSNLPQDLKNWCVRQLDLGR
jgi:hypothetical protein